MYYITPITEDSYVMEQIKVMVENAYQKGYFPPEPDKKLKKRYHICTIIRKIFAFLFITDILFGYYFITHNINMEIYHFVNEEIIPALYLITYLALSVYQEHPKLSSMQIIFYEKIFVFFIAYTAFCNILTSYHIDGLILFLLIAIEILILCLSNLIYTAAEITKRIEELAAISTYNLEP